jgi:hypothetical protein
MVLLVFLIILLTSYVIKSDMSDNIKTSYFIFTAVISVLILFSHML